MKLKLGMVLLIFLLLGFRTAMAQDADSDNDGLTDSQETNIYHTNINNPDSDGDGFKDGDEVIFGFDPNISGNDKLEKFIHVSLKDQELVYSLGPYVVGQFKVSTGVRNTTPKGEYKILVKKPVVHYKGSNYDYPNTRWNMMFKQVGAGRNLYIHGAYWHNNFGKPMSHGCVNVAYKDMEPLYNWADTGTKVVVE